MAEDKAFYQEVVEDTPFPGEPEPVVLPGQPNPTGTYTPTVTKAKSFPTRKVATELIGTVLNTKSRKILGEFQLEQSGGIKVGDFKDGVSGEVALTRAGLVAKNKAGLTTFALDGDTGDAVFAGTVQAGSVIAAEIDADLIVADQLDAIATKTGTLTIDESITVGGVANGTVSVKDSSNNEKVLLDNTGLTINTGKITLKDSTETTIIDATGLVSTANFTFATQSPSNQQPTGTGVNTWIDVSGATQTITLTRASYVLVLCTALVNMVDLAETGKFRMNVGGDTNGPIAVFGVIQDGSGQSTETLWHILQVASGGVTFKLQCAADTGHDMVFQSMKMAYIVLGK